MITNKEKLRWLALEAQKNNKAFIAMDNDASEHLYEVAQILSDNA